MSFTSFQFWIIFPFLFAVYWLIPVNRPVLKKACLIVSSMVMYMLWNPLFLFVMAGVCLITYYAGIVAEERDTNKWRVLSLLIIIAFVPLFIFKYWAFFASIIDKLSYNRVRIAGLNWAVPVGISFYTFQAIGYALDVKRRRIHAERNLLDYSLFISFFPQIMCGPISKAEELIPQLKNPGQFNGELATKGFHLLVWGMFMKFALADRLGLLVDAVYSNPGQYSGANILAATLLYSFQIYGDFAGYSFMAVGIAGLLGISLINNFRRPYLAMTVTDFWKRWHISLTRWLKENIYIPLGGNRKGQFRTYLNILLTFLVSGIWHGAAWTFVIWGILHGITLCVERRIGISRVKEVPVLPKLVMTVVSFSLVSLFWVFFRASTLSGASELIGRICLSFGKLDLKIMGTDYLYNIALILPIVFIKDIYDEFFKHKIQIKLFDSGVFNWCLSAFVLFLVMAFGVLDSSQFIYSGF
jgi:D-alanyl-lipoteichoic acid acyltransferase DltB (MBOAT superfamily)